MSKATRIRIALSAVGAVVAAVAIGACSSTGEPASPQGATTESTSYAPVVRVLDVGAGNITVSASAGDLLVLDPVDSKFDRHAWKISVSPKGAAAVANDSVAARTKGKGIPVAPLVAFAGTDTAVIVVKQKETGFTQKITVKVASASGSDPAKEN